MRDSTTYQSTICLDTNEGYVECPATFDIESTQYAAEPYSWGQSRGTESEAKAELLTATFGGLTLDRSQCETITGAEHLSNQEKQVAEQYLEAVSMGDAA